MDATEHGERWRSAGVLVIAAVLLTACGTEGTTGGQDEALDGHWVLAEGAGPDGTVELDVGLEQPVPVTLRIDGDAWTGSAACNSYSGIVAVEDGAITNDLAFTVTEMACEPPALMTVESAYLAALAVVDEADLTTADDAADALTLTGPDALLRFTREPEADTDTDAELDTGAASAGGVALPAR